MEELDLREILKDVPKGTKLYSPIYGDVKFKKINDTDIYPVLVEIQNGMNVHFTKEGKYMERNTSAECMLFPSKEQRDWSKFNVDVLEIGIPVVVSDNLEDFIIGRYAGNGKVEYIKRFGCITTWKYIIPYEKFDPNNIEESIKFNIVREN